MDMRIKLVVCAAALSLPAAALAENAQPNPAPASTGAQAPAAAGWSSFKTWLTHLKEGLAKSSVERHYQRRSVSAVAAVRGAEQKLDDPNKPYVKDPAAARAAKSRRQERAEFSAAVDLLLAGKMDEGLKKLDEFEAKHPKSSLLPDVREARQKAKDIASKKEKQ